MYELMTYETILENMLDRVPDGFDKREGSIIYDALAPAAYELSQAYAALDDIIFNTFADTAEYDFLERRAAERGINRKQATHAIFKGQFNIDVNLNTTFAIGDFTYTTIERISEGFYKLQCNEAGVAANATLGALLPVEYIDGLTTATLTELLIPGEDIESDDSLRERYYASLNAEAFGGNIADYKSKVATLNGVGGVKVYPIWNGGGTVKIVFSNSDYGQPSAALINNIQTLVDPTANAGEGIGIAPIGHVVTVAGVAETTVNIATTITYETGYTFADVKTSIQAAVDAYLLELATAWHEQEYIIVRVSRIETRLLDIPGIMDAENTTLNNVAGNLPLAADSIPVRGTINGE